MSNVQQRSFDMNNLSIWDHLKRSGWQKIENSMYEDLANHIILNQVL